MSFWYGKWRLNEEVFLSDSYVGPTEEETRAFLIAFATAEGYISPLATDMESVRRREEALRKVRAEVAPLIEASRRAERMTQDDHRILIDLHPSFGIGGGR